MNVFLQGLDWSRMNINNALLRENDIIKDAKAFYGPNCSRIHLNLITRCLMTRYTAMYLLAGNRSQSWEQLKFRDIGGPYVAYAIEIDVYEDPRYDHTFVLFKDGNRWFIIQSYINVNRTSITEIDFNSFISSLRKWADRIDNNEWAYYFGAPLPIQGQGIFYIYGLRSYTPGIKDRALYLMSRDIDLCNNI